MFWHTPLSARPIGSTRLLVTPLTGLSDVYVVVDYRQGLGAVEEYVVDEVHVTQTSHPGTPEYIFTGAGAYAYSWLDQTGTRQTRLNPNYVPVPWAVVAPGAGAAPSTPPGSPAGAGSPPSGGLGVGAPTPAPLGAGVAGSYTPPWGHSVMSGFAMQYMRGNKAFSINLPPGLSVGWDDVDHSPDGCKHTDLVDTGMPVRYCKHCPAKLRLVNLEWVVDAR